MIGAELEQIFCYCQAELTHLLDGGVEKTEERKQLEKIFLDQSGCEVRSVVTNPGII